MDIATMVVVFLSALAVAGCVMLAFSAPIDGALSRLISGEMAAAWSRYAKFALLVASFTGGLRLKELENLAGLGLTTTAPSPIKMTGCLMEVYKTIAGSLTGASWTLLAFFGATLLAYAGMQVYESVKAPAAPRSADRHGGVTAGRY